MINFKVWIDRINNELEISKFYQKELVNMSFTRAELIELRLMISTLQEQLNDNQEKQQNSNSWHNYGN